MAPRRRVRQSKVAPKGKARAKVFWTGRSQAVRLPKAYRVATREVAVSRQGNTLILEPVETARDAQGWPRAFWALAGAAPSFDLGDRRTPHERNDVFRKLR